MASAGNLNGQPRSGSNSNVYSQNDGHDPRSGYAATLGHSFDRNWSIDPSLASVNSPDPTNFNSQSWGHNPSSQPHHQHQHQYEHQHQHQHQHRQQHNAIPAYAPTNNLYAAPLSSAASYPNATPTFNPQVPYHPPAFDGAIDPALSGSNVQRNGVHGQRTPYFANHTIAPAALQNNSLQSATSAPVHHPQTQNGVRSIPPGYVYVPSRAQPPPLFCVTVPKGTVKGTFTTIDADILAKATKSEKFSPFLHMGIDLGEFNCTRIGSIPQYIPRVSRKEFKILSRSNPKLIGEPVIPLCDRDVDGVTNKIPDKLSKKQAKVGKPKALKIPRPRLPIAGGRAPSAASSPSSDYSSSSEDESEYSDSDDELDIEESPPLPPTRPDEPLKATSYDMIKAVWLPRRTYPSTEQIRKSLADVWEVLSTIRDRWKSDNDALKQATEKKREKEMPMLKERVQSQRALLEVALAAALEHGNPEIVKLMGEIRPFVQMCSIFSTDRAKDGDYDCLLVKNLFELLSRSTTVTDDVLDQFKLKKILAVFKKRGNDEMKKLATKLEEVAAANSKAKAEKEKESTPATDVKPSVETSGAARVSTPDVVAGVKRPHSADAAGAGHPVKRVASGTAPGSKVASTLPKRSASAGSEKGMSAVGVGAKPKAAPAKNPSLLGLKAASKRSGPADAAKKTGTGIEKKPVVAPAPPVQKPGSFNFAAYMSDLNKPKEPEPSKTSKVDKGPPETEEQRAKRLRKESRRHLRVHFKDGPALVEVRIFHHDPEEETGHDESSMRDAGDLNSEGKMFKQHKNQLEAEEEEEIEEDVMIAWRTPSAVDFTTLPAEVRDDKPTANFERFGGVRKGVFTEKEVQEKRESATLMVYYSDRSEIPPSPREPADPYSGEPETRKEFGQPDEKIRTRLQTWPSQVAPTAAPVATGPVDVAALLRGLGMHPASQTGQQPPQAANTFGNNQATTAGQQNQSAMSLGYAGAAAQPPAAGATDPSLAAVLAILSAHGTKAQQQAQAETPQPAAVALASQPAFQTTQAATPTVDAAQVAAWFAAAGMQPPSVPSGYAPSPQQQQQDHAATGLYENPDRKRMREAGDVGGAEKAQGELGWVAALQGQGQAAAGAGVGRNKKRWIGDGQRPKFVKQCSFWVEGRCLKGADCTYLHE